MNAGIILKLTNHNFPINGYIINDLIKKYLVDLKILQFVLTKL